MKTRRSTDQARTTPPAPAIEPAAANSLTFMVQVRAPFAQLCEPGGLEQIVAAAATETRGTLVMMMARAAAAGGWAALQATAKQGAEVGPTPPGA